MPSHSVMFVGLCGGSTPVDSKMRAAFYLHDSRCFLEDNLIKAPRKGGAIQDVSTLYCIVFCECETRQVGLGWIAVRLVSSQAFPERV